MRLLSVIANRYFCDDMMQKLILILILFSPALLWPQENGTLEYSKYSDSVEVNVVKHSLADSIFSFVKHELDFIEFDDCNNCDSRAHLVAAIIDKRFGVRSAKVWLFADSKRSSQREKYRLKPEGRLTNKDDCTGWGWHTAPIVIINNGTSQDTLVIDPSTADRAVTISEWAGDLIPEGTKAFVIIKDSRYLAFPKDEAGKFEDAKPVWFEEDGRVLEDADYSRSISSILDARYGIYDPWSNRSFEKRIRKLLK
jgi:hypothetical protein